MINRYFDTTGGGKNLPSITRWLMGILKGYNHEKYWRRRSMVVDSKSKTPLVLKLYYLFYIKRKDAKLHCSFGTGLNYGAHFETPPFLPHGPHGIIVGSDAKVGSGCIIYHQVTIAGGNVIIGDRVELGAGSKVLPNVKIGNHCHVGANAVVVEDMPDYSTCVLQKPRIILKSNQS
jgi:serine acetyltransferase